MQFMRPAEKKLRQSTSVHKRSAYRWLSGWFFIVCLLSATPVHADLTTVPGLTPAQAAAAAANQEIYNTLVNQSDLTGAELELFLNAQELVHTANELQGSGPTSNSLSLDLEGLQGALQWNAQEESVTQGSMVSKALGGQNAALIGRLVALRSGATGVAINERSPKEMADYAGAGQNINFAGQRGGAAGDGQPGGLGIFLNGSQGWGDQDPTLNEDAFEYDSNDLTVGMDYHFGQNLILGTALGYSKMESDFDSAQSIVDGSVDADGFTLSAFGNYAIGNLYIDGIASYGMLDFDTVRKIKYPSNNPLIPPVNEQADGSTDSSQYNLAAGIGYNGSYQALSFEPYARVSYLNATIDGYTETNANVFNLKYQDQEIDSLISTLGLSTSYAISYQYGVLVPQLRAEWNHEFQNDSRNINSSYAGSGPAVANVFISTPTEDPDRDFFVVSAGLSAVFKNGLQAFVSYQTLLGYDNFTSNLVTAGGRLEF
jgi:outer membrane lipase/esterase